MKPKITYPGTMFLLPMLLIASLSRAQQTTEIEKQPRQSPAHSFNNPASVSYTYKIFQSPNKNFGYDILMNGKLVYHEFASMHQQENQLQTKNPNTLRLHNPNTDLNKKEFGALSKKEHAEKAALLAIEKMKKRESPMLSQDELRNITAQ
jgi:UDP:flavonoid glycosyltransferase YjiC (YdhE family)